MTIQENHLNLQGGALTGLTVDWLAGNAEMTIAQPPGAQPPRTFTIRFNGLDRLIVPRQNEWRGEMGIADAFGPIALDGKLQHFRLQMQSGDIIEIDFVTYECHPALQLEPPVAPPSHPEIPDVHDAQLRDVALRWSESTAEILIGPLFSETASAFGAAYVVLRFEGLRRFIYPQRRPWDYFNSDVLSILGPVRVEQDSWHLRIVMQEGDIIEIDYGSLTVGKLDAAGGHLPGPSDHGRIPIKAE